MPSRMLHYYVAEQVARQVPISDRNRFFIGSLCPDMTSREDGSKQETHFFDVSGNKKGVNWKRFEQEYEKELLNDALYAGILCHLITDAIWFYEMAEPLIRSVCATKQERDDGYLKGYADFHKLNYLLHTEVPLSYHMTEDRNITLRGIHPEKYEDVFGGMYADFFHESVARKEELTIYHFEAVMVCMDNCVKECVEALTCIREKKPTPEPERYYVPVRNW